MPIAQARGLVLANNLRGALALLATAITGVSSSADRFGRLASAQVCLEAHQYASRPGPQLRGLDRSSSTTGWPSGNRPWAASSMPRSTQRIEASTWPWAR